MPVLYTVYVVLPLPDTHIIFNMPFSHIDALLLPSSVTQFSYDECEFDILFGLPYLSSYITYDIFAIFRLCCQVCAVFMSIGYIDYLACTFNAFNTSDGVCR